MAQRFYGGQNSNNFSEWTAVDTSGTKNFSLAAGSALGGTAFGLLWDGGAGTHRKLTYNIPTTGVAEIRIAFRLNIDTFAMSGFGFHNIFEVTKDGGTETHVCWLGLKENGGFIFANMEVRIDSGASISVTSPSLVHGGDITLECRLKKASSAVANDGEAEIFVNGFSVVSNTSLDIFNRMVVASTTRVHLIADGGASGTPGNYDVDEFYYRDDVTPIFPPTDFSGYDLVLGGGQP